MKLRKASYLFASLALFAQACSLSAQPKPTAQPTETASPSPAPTQTPPRPTETPAPATPTPTSNPAPRVTISAVKGNLFIRRGPDMAFNPIGVLYQGATAEVLAHDVLSKWAQIAVPNSDQIGWVSLMTQYSQIEGDISALPELTVTDWPQPGYVRNCSLHRMVLEPGNIYVESLLGEPENLAWVYPGFYDVYDIDMPDPVEVDSIEIREGITVDILYNGAGVKHKCP